MKNEIEQGLHEKLCAYVLGEAGDAERAEIERALEQSPELRAERERLEKTIGLVKETLSGAEALPLSAVAQVLSAATGPRRRPWHLRPAWRMAAGFAAVALGGYVVFRVVDTRGESAEPFRYEIFGEARPFRDGPVAEKGYVAAPESKAESPSLVAQAHEAANAEPAPVDVSGDAGSDYTYQEPGDSVAAGSALAAAQTTPVTVEMLERLDSTYRFNQTDEQILLARVQAPAEKDAELRTGLLTTTSPPAGADASSTPAGVGGGAAASERTRFAGVAIEVSKAAAAERPAGPSSGAGPSSSGPSPSLAPAGGPSGPSTVASSGGKAGLALTGDERVKGERVALVAEDKKVDEIRKSLAGLGYVDEENARDRRASDGDDFFLGRGAEGRGLSLADRLRALSPAERDQYVELQCQRILLDCRRRPNERPRDMFFRFWGDNPFELSGLDPLSTFSIDVDTASYTLARRYLNEDKIPEKAQIRTEEFVNYFKADVPAPAQGTFAIHTDLAPSRFGRNEANRWMMRVVVRGREVAKVERAPLNLTFVIDVSGSMREQNRLEMVKHAIRLLLNELGPRDRIALVAFSADAQIVLPTTSAADRSRIESALHPLQPQHGTNSEAGLQLGYGLALASLDAEANNRVIFLSDGVANVGETDPVKLGESVRPIREKGVYLNTIGVGMNNHNDALLEQLADKGDGVCNYVDTPAEARRVIVENFTGAFETIARDVKIQVEFDPAQVLRYRLLGYENRAIADQDFRNDQVDAGEVGAGHQVTALYEVERLANASEKPIATVRLRWKAPRKPGARPAEAEANEKASEIAKPVTVARQTSFEGAGVAYRRAVIVAQFAEILRRSVHARGDSLDDAIVEADKLRKEIQDPEFDELFVLMNKCRQRVLQALPVCDDLCEAIDTLRRNHLRRCEDDLLAQSDPKRTDAKQIEDLERRNAELEGRIKNFLRQQIEGKPGVR